MNQIRRAGISALFIIIFTLISKILGFLREILVASRFGSGLETDAYFVAITATSLIITPIWTAINASLIPILSEIEFKEGHKAKIKHINNMINIVVITTFVFVIMGWLLTPMIIKIIAHGFNGKQFDLAVSLTRIGFPKLILGCSIGVFIGFLHSEQRFKSVSSINIFASMVIIAYILFLSSRFGIKGLMFASLLSVAVQIIVLFPALIQSGYKYKFIINIRDTYLKRFGYLILPIFLGTAIQEINVIIDQTLASRLITGSISALSYANKLNSLILEVFVVTITTVLFPMLSNLSNTNDINGMKKIMGYGINTILIITIPAAVGLIVLAKPIVKIAFERGAFDATATVMTSQALIFYSLGIVPMALRLFITNVYFSLQDTKTPMINSAIAIVFNIILNLILVKFMAHSGLALATSIATTIATFSFFYDLKKKIGSWEHVKYIKYGFKSGAASIIMGFIVYKMYYGMVFHMNGGTVFEVGSLLTAIGIGVIAYLTLCYAFGIEEVHNVVNAVKGKLKKAD